MKMKMTNINIEKPSLDELNHYGVLGMHWGKHKRVDSAEIIKAREHLSKTKENLAEARKQMNKETGLNSWNQPSKETFKKLDVASREHKYAKQDLASAKILDRLNSKEKSKLQLSTEEKYKQKGMSPDEAAVAAYQNIRTKKILLAVGATTLAVAGGYAAYKFHDERVDKIIKSGTLLQNIAPDSDKGVRDAFYSAGNKLDKAKYKGLYGDQLNARGGAFKKEIKVLSDIKQASHKSAQSALSDLAKTDHEFTKGLKDYLSSGNKIGGAYTDKFKQAEKSLSKGIVDKNVYEVFNAALVDHSPEMQTLTDRFYNKLSEKGYNALKDVNDSKYSGYKTINPIIAFNSSGKVDVVDVKQLTYEEIKKARSIAYGSLATPELVKQGAIIAGSVLGLNLAGAKGQKQIADAKVKQYRDKHPNTKMTNTEIIRSIERSK